MSVRHGSRWLRFLRQGHAMRPVAIGALVAGTALCGATSHFASAQPQAQAPVPVGAFSAAGGMVQLAGSLHPLAQPGVDVGRMDPGRRVSNVWLTFRMSPQQKAASTALQITLQDPTSPRYHQWLTPEQYAAQFGARPADVERVAAWLRAQGLDVGATSRMSTHLEFGGTVSQIEQAFRTELHLYQIDGEQHFAMAMAPSIPADLASVVLGVHNLHDFRPKPPTHPLYTLPLPGLDGGLINYPAMSPPDFATLYDLNPLYEKSITGTGQHIAIAGQTEFNDADIANFRSTFGLSAVGPTRHLVPNSGNPFYSPGDITESELDLEWSGAVARDATIDFVYTGDNSAGGVFDAMTYAIEQHIAPIVSVSYGGAEITLSPADAVFNESLGDAASLTGITVLAAAGDSGASDDDRGKAARHGETVDWPGSIPTVVAVGGTQFNLTQSNIGTLLSDGGATGGPGFDPSGYITESGWNETWDDLDAGIGGIGAGGGGVSKVFAKPYWQIPYTPNDNFRDVPDVALSASAEIYPYVVSYSWPATDGDAQAPQPEALTAVGGTSAAAPSFAGMLALVNQSLAALYPKVPVGLGNPNPVLYALANNKATADAFNDVTTGNNIVPCQPGSPDCPASPPYQFGYSCGKGYDQVTGLGTINAASLVAAFTTLTPTSTTLTVTESGMTEGSPITLDATVASMATSTALTGDVTFYFLTYDAAGDIDLSGVLGSVAITPSTSGNEGGTAHLTAKAPAGLLQADAGLTGGAKIGAVYGGDIHYLSSWSSLSQVAGTSTLSICPESVTMAPSHTGFQFQATGGSAPLTWGVYNDTTCARETITLDGGATSHVEVCSSITDAGVFTAGPAPGVAQVIAYDSNSAYTSAYVNVVADAGAPPPANCTPPADAGMGEADGGAGADAAVSDSGSVASGDAAMSADGGPGGGGSSGCGCTTAGGGGTTAAGGFAGLLLALAAITRRRRGSSK